MSCIRILAALEDCQRKHRNNRDLVCSSLTAAAGWCIFYSVCPKEVRAIEDCIGISKSIGKAPVIPAHCAHRAAALEACIEAQQILAEQKINRCVGPQPVPKHS
eukprot:jgi/Chrzof1/15225/Cz09g32040.t1